MAPRPDVEEMVEDMGEGVVFKSLATSCMRCAGWTPRSGSRGESADRLRRFAAEAFGVTWVEVRCSCSAFGVSMVGDLTMKSLGV